MKVNLKRKTFAVCDRCLKEHGKIVSAEFVCLGCKIDICNECIFHSFRDYGNDWIPSCSSCSDMPILGFCCECGEMYDKHAYERVDGLGGQLRQAFYDLYKEKAESALESVRKEMSNILVSLYGEVKMAQGDKVAEEKRRERLLSKKRKLEAEISKLGNSL